MKTPRYWLVTYKYNDLIIKNGTINLIYLFSNKCIHIYAHTYIYYIYIYINIYIYICLKCK